MLPDSLINTVSPDTLKENHLARFIHRARTNFGVLHVASGALPYYRTKKTFYYQNPNHFVNINFFNLRVKALFGISYCFDMIMAEQDYWLSNNPITAPNLDSNWTVFYLAGIRYMYQTVRNTSNSSGYNPLLITTYIGDLTVLTDTPFAAKNYIAEQSQVDSIDKYTDIDYIDFYLNGDKMDKYNSIDGSLQIFRYDKRKGYRMFRFANNTKPSYIVPLFNAQAAVDILNVSYLGDNLINQNGICFNPSDSTWRRTVDGVTSYFDSLFTNKINPYNLHSSSFIDTTKTSIISQITLYAFNLINIKHYFIQKLAVFSIIYCN